LRSRNITVISIIVTSLLFSGCLGSEEGSLPETGSQEGQELTNVTGNQSAEELISTNVAWATGVTGCLTVALHLVVYDLEGTDHGALTVPSDAHGGNFEAHLTSTAPPVEWGIAFWSGEDLAEAFYSMEDTLNGTVPNSDMAVFFSCGGADLDVHISVTG
jgi:hypothetical protein